MIGWNVLLATLNQINEKDQNIIDNTTALYIFTCLFNLEIRFIDCVFALRIYNNFQLNINLSTVVYFHKIYNTQLHVL